MTGGVGNDTLLVDPAGGALTLNGTSNISAFEVFNGGGQIVQGTTGSNTLDFSGLASVVGVSAILGLAGNDTITGSGGGDTFDGGPGNDLINGGAGDDVIKIRAAEAQSDTMTGGIGNDTLLVDSAGGALTLNGTSNISAFEVFNGGGQIVQGTTGANTLDFSGFASVVGVAAISGLGGNDIPNGQQRE